MAGKKRGDSRAAGRPFPSHWGGMPDPEDLDPTPMEVAIQTARPTPLNELIAQFVRAEVERETNQEFESFEEADDFELEPGDDGELLDMSPYTLSDLQDKAPIPEDPPEAPAEETAQAPPEAPEEAPPSESAA